MSEHIGPFLDAYLDDETPASKRAAIEAHLAGCAMCRDEVKNRRRISALLREAPPIMALDPDTVFASKIQSQLPPRPVQTWTIERVLKLGWQALPIGLLLAIVFINTVSFLSNLAAFIPGFIEPIHTELNRFPIELSFSDPLRIFLELSGIFQLPEWSWITGIALLLIISLVYISWMAISLVQYRPTHEQQSISL